MGEHPRLKARLLKNKEFLKKLQGTKEARKRLAIIKSANSSEIYTLFRVLCCIAHGHIPIRQMHHFHLKKSKRLHMLTKLQCPSKKIRKNKKNIRETVQKFASVYDKLLHPLFHK